jgi:hypothetical protein
MTARAGGHAEPEFRLPAMIFPAIIGPMGVLTFGMVITTKKNYMGAAVGFAMLGFGLTSGSNAVVTYAVDGYHPVSCHKFDVLARRTNLALSHPDFC